MQPRLPSVLATIVLGLAAGAILGGCGSSQQDSVSVAQSPPAASTASSTPSSSAAVPSTATSTTPAPTVTSGGTAAPAGARTAPEPAFTQQEQKSEGASGAVAQVRAHGYTPNDASEYHEDQTLQVLLGTRTGSSDGYDQQAFFFLGGHYLGTDAKEPSASVKVLSQGDTEVALAYTLYRPGDPLASPSGGQAIVRFQLDNGQLTPLGRIPSANPSSALSRR